MPETDPTTTTETGQQIASADEIVLALARSRATTADEFEAVDRFSDRARATDRDDLDLVWQLAVRVESTEEAHRRAVASLSSYLNGIGIWTPAPDPWPSSEDGWRAAVLDTDTVQARLGEAADAARGRR